MWTEQHCRKFVKSESCYNQLEEKSVLSDGFAAVHFHTHEKQLGGPSGLTYFHFVS